MILENKTRLFFYNTTKMKSGFRNFNPCEKYWLYCISFFILQTLLIVSSAPCLTIILLCKVLSTIMQNMKCICAIFITIFVLCSLFPVLLLFSRLYPSSSLDNDHHLYSLTSFLELILRSVNVCILMMMKATSENPTFFTNNIQHVTPIDMCTLYFSQPDSLWILVNGLDQPELVNTFCMYWHQ